MNSIIFIFLVVGFYFLYRRGNRHTSISNKTDEESLMERATNMATLNHLHSAKPTTKLNYRKQHLLHMNSNDDFHDQQLMDSANATNYINDMHDPYKNPGLDHVIDESYHGIDHGLGIANPEQHHHNNEMF